jgi:peptidase E
MTTRYYRQCKLMQNTSAYSRSRITYLPEAAEDGTPLAVEGGFVQLFEDQAWTATWEVVQVHVHRFTEHEIARIRDQDVRAAGEGRPSRKIKSTDYEPEF